MVNANFYLGNIYAERDELIKAIDYYLEAARISSKDESLEKYKIFTNINISNCYSQLGEKEECIQSLKIALSYIGKIKLKEENYIRSVIYSGLMANYNSLNKRDSAEYYVNELILINKKIENDSSLNNIRIAYNIGSNYARIVNYYLEIDNLEKARIYYKKFNSLKFVSPKEKYSIDLFFAIKTNQLDKAKKLLNSLPESVDTSSSSVYYDLTAQYYQKTKNYKQSLAFYKKYTEHQLKELKTQKVKLSTYSQNRMESIESKNNLRLLKKEQAFQKRFSRMTYGLIALLAIILALLYYAYKQIQIRNKFLNKDLENKSIIEKQTKQLQFLAEQKNKLFTNIAHEFQTPLNIIQGLGKEISKAEKLSPNGYESLGIILKNSNYLSKTTSQILSLNNGASGSRISANLVCFSLQALFQHILPEYRFLAKKKLVTLEEPDFKEVAIYIYSELDKIETILKNLLSNAIKYSEKEGCVSIEYQENDLGYHEFIFNDNGRGISKEDLPNVFDRYYQSSINKAEGGFGLGLAICKEYIESLEGNINVKSEQGKWTSFTIRLPKTSEHILASQTVSYNFPEVAVTQSLSLVTPLNNESLNASVELLIVEDNLDFCKFLALILEKDYHLVFAHNGEQALSYLEKHTPYLIITDWMMPGMDGLEFVQYLKTSEKYNHLPILMLTAKTLITDKLKALRVGIDDYLIKPIEEEILKDRISKLLHSLEEQREDHFQFPYRESNTDKLQLSLADQNWLVQIEQNIAPLLGKFDLNLEQIAKLSDISVTKLSLKIKEITGLTPKKYIQEMRYWEARRMLETGEFSSVKIVALSVGFKDAKNFSRRFKERFGKYPSEYMVTV